MIYYQVFDSCVVNERLHPEISKFKVSVHLGMVIKSRKEITFLNFIGRHT